MESVFQCSEGFIIMCVIKAIIPIVIHEKKKLRNPSVLYPAAATSPSVIKIEMPIFNFVLSEISRANKSVPPVLVSFRSMTPMPIPIKLPPIRELKKIGKEN